jgi:peptidoglycan-associated lipoprotein
MTHKAIVLFSLLAGSLFLAGCPGPAVKGDVDGPPIEPAPGADTTGFDDDSIGEPEPFFTEGPDDPLSKLVIYFQYDQSDIGADYNEMLGAHGGYLSNNPSASVRLEGHADERGSREYNIGLGERRAQAVRRVLLLQGASGTQITTVSYGEERPSILGSDEEAMTLNRRVELVYRQ